MKEIKGHLVIIGGAEDRQDDKQVLKRVVELAGGPKARMVVLTTASKLAHQDPSVAVEFENLYENAFRDCGAEEVTTLHIHDRFAADDRENAKIVGKATGIFMTGGDQSRLVSILGGTAVGKAMLEAFQKRGACISGTSAGASAISEHMVAGGSSDLLPKKGMLPMAPGLGFLRNVVIDQHFSQRHRLGRLMSVVAQTPFLIGIGIDEDTGLVVTPDLELEVVGSGAVTILDGRHMSYSNVNDVDRGDVIALTSIQLHLLPTGFRFSLESGIPGEDPDFAPAVAFRNVIETLVASR